MRTFPRHEVLSAEDEITLARRSEAGVLAHDALAAVGPDHLGFDATIDELHWLVADGRAAERTFLLANLGLIGLVTARVPRFNGASDDDLFQDGFCGLLNAWWRFDWRRGIRFATYALPWIRAEVINTVAAAQVGGASPNDLRRRRELERRESDLTSGLGRAPSTAELSTSMGRSQEWIEYHRSVASSVSFDVLEASDLAEFIEPNFDDEEEKNAIDHAQVADLVLGLKSPLREVLTWRFGFGCEPLSVSQIAARLRVSRSTVGRIEQRALAEMRELWVNGLDELVVSRPVRPADDELLGVRRTAAA